MRHSGTGDMPLAYNNHTNKECDDWGALRACRYLRTGRTSSSPERCFSGVRVEISSGWTSTNGYSLYLGPLMGADLVMRVSSV